MPVDPTPVRSLGQLGADGCVVLRDAGVGYRDGGEDEVLRLIQDGKDLASDSDELIRSASGWAQIYHLHPARANIVRVLDLPSDARVLEIGAGCGAITRYLGETCALVDALEPVPIRASAARARTRDLPNVEVFVGELSDVPAVAAYDVVVVIGVLEYVGNGTADRAPYQAFLQGIADRLVDGGTLVHAIENQLGVKYLVGAPEDHTNRLYDSLEGYPSDTPARTFSRLQLHDMFSATGLRPSFFAAFPDYKLTRAVLGEFPTAARSLLHRIPQFPSPDWMGHRPRLADEHAVWRSLVDAGLEAETGNSFLIVAGKNVAASLWPAENAGTFYSVGRRTTYTAETVVARTGDTVEFRRSAVNSASRTSQDLFELVTSTRAYAPGVDLLAHVAGDKNADVPGLIAAWLRMLDQPGATESLDLLPHNLVLDPDGALQPIDVELHFPTSREQIVHRGVYWMGYKVARLSAFDRWPQFTTVRDLTLWFGELAGLDTGGEWLDVAIAQEAIVQTEIHYAPPPDELDAAIARNADGLRAALGQLLLEMPLGLRPDGSLLAEHEQLVVAALRAERLADRLSAERGVMDRRVHVAEDRADQMERAFHELRNSRAVRFATSIRRGLDRMAPLGTKRRKSYLRLTRRRS